MKPIHLFLFIIMCFSGGRVVFAEDSIVLTADTPWIVAAGEPEAMQRALADVERDWTKVFGHRPVVLNRLPDRWSGPVVYLGTKQPGREGMPEGAEGFVLRVANDDGGRLVLAAAGSDLRGAMFAAYALSEEILGVDPWYYWTDREPEQKREIKVAADLDRVFEAPTFRYRGWFINDEDLLARFSPDPLRENVYSLEMLERICETILRLRGNMIVPGTFNFPDERALELASRRGLVLNMHHIQVVGLNTFRWPKDVPFSLNKHPEIMEGYWRVCINAYKNREVVWTVGYRGKHDHPFWVDEPGLDTAEARGEVMTRAVARQVELIREVDPDAVITSNLWMEGVGMLQAGHFKLPEDVIQVWPDDMGNGIITDKGAVVAGQGVYYHTAMYTASRNQLSEMIPPGRIYAELGRFARAKATSFLLVNVSDVRAVPLSTDCVMRFGWDARPYLDKSDRENMDAFLMDWSRRQFGDDLAKEVAAIYERYFAIPYHQRPEIIGDNQLHTLMRRPDAAALKFASANRPYVERLLEDARALDPRVPDARRDFYQFHVLTMIGIHRHSLVMLEEYCAAKAALAEGDKAQALDRAEKALAATGELFASLRAAEYGKWSGWYSGDLFVGMEGSRDLVRVLLAELNGEPAPPVRDRPNFYQKIYEYQIPFLDNFPLMYPRKGDGPER